MGIIKEMHGDIEQEAIHLLARYRDALMMEAISLTSPRLMGTRQKEDRPCKPLGAAPRLMGTDSRRIRAKVSV